MKNVSPRLIESLEPHEVFVFGSNLLGIHGAGAARTAAKKFGAVPGIGSGLMGQSYAIPTRFVDDKGIFRSMTLELIEEYVDMFLDFAKTRRDLAFLVTEIGCGYAGHLRGEIAPMFFKAPLPPNVFLPESFWRFAPALGA